MKAPPYLPSFVITLALVFLGACDSTPTPDNTEFVVIDRISVSNADFDAAGGDGTGPDIYVSVLTNGVEAFNSRNNAIGGVREQDLPVVIDFSNPPRIRVQSGRAISVEVWDKDTGPIEAPPDDLMGESEEVNLVRLIEDGAPRTLSLRERQDTPQMSVTLHLDYQ